MGKQIEGDEVLDGGEWPTVAIIVLNWNSYEDTAECLRSLEDISYPDYEVVVVDNGSTDGSGEALAEEFDWCQFVFNEENLGFAGGNNAGISYALESGSPYITLLNNDAVVDEDFLIPLVRTAERHDHVAAVSGVIYKAGSSDVWYAGGHFDPTLVRGGFDQEVGDRTEYEVGKVTGALALMPREFVANHDVLNDDYFIGLEDTELSWLAREHGWKLLVNTRSEIQHKVNASRGMHNAYAHYHSTYNRLTFSKNHHSLRQRVVFYVFLAATRSLRFAQWGLSGNKSLIYATLLGAYDFYVGNDPKKRQALLYENDD